MITFLNDVRVALRSLLRTKGLTATVVLTLALGIGANDAIFTLVRGVLLTPLVNRDEARLIYIRQSALGMGAENMTFSVPEIQDLRERLLALAPLATLDHRFHDGRPGEPREVRAGVVGGRTEVMGCARCSPAARPRDDGPAPRGRSCSPTVSGDGLNRSLRARAHGEAGDEERHHRGRPGAPLPYPAETRSSRTS